MIYPLKPSSTHPTLANPIVQICTKYSRQPHTARRKITRINIAVFRDGQALFDVPEGRDGFVMKLMDFDYIGDNSSLHKEPIDLNSDAEVKVILPHDDMKYINRFL